MESNMISSEHIQIEVLNITSEHPSSEDHFERKSQAKISPSDQIFEKQEEQLIYFRGKNTRNQTISHQNTFKMKCLLSPLNIHITKITLRVNYKPIFFH